MLQINELDAETLLSHAHLLTWKQRFSIVAIFWILFGVMGYFMWWRDDLAQAEQQNLEITDALSRLNSQSSLLLEQPKLEVDLAKLRAQLPVLKQSLPSDRELATLLDRINKVIQSNRMGLSEFVPEESQYQEVMRVVPVKLSVTGKGRDVSLLPNHVARLTRQATLKDFEVVLSETTGEWELHGQLLAYAQLPANAPQPAGAK